MQENEQRGQVRPGFRLLSPSAPVLPASSPLGSSLLYLASSEGLWSGGGCGWTQRGGTWYGWDLLHFGPWALAPWLPRAGAVSWAHLPPWPGEGRRLTYRDGPEGLGAVPHAVEGPALVSPIVFQGPHGQQAVDDHLVEGLPAQHLQV